MKGLLNGERTQRYVNLMMDSGFKAVFADKSNKKLLVGLLNHFSRRQSTCGISCGMATGSVMPTEMAERRPYWT